MHPLDATAAKRVATAHSRVDKRMGKRSSDRGYKDIDTVVALIRFGLLDVKDIVEKANSIQFTPSYLAELDLVLREVSNLVK